MTFCGAGSWPWLWRRIADVCTAWRGQSKPPICVAETLEDRRLLSIASSNPISSAASGSLSGQATAAVSANDLTTLGAEDWAHWGRGGVFGKFDHDADGGSEISDISLVGSGTQTGAATDSALTFNWTNGSHLQTATAEDGYITDAGAVGSGFSFTVPADTDSRTLTVFAGGDNARITLDAHLSDSSAADYTFTAASPGLFNEAITITYSAASADQELTITLTKQGDAGGGATGSVDLASAALNLDSIKTLATFDSAPTAGPVMDNEGNFYATFRDAKGFYGLYEIPGGGGRATEMGTFPQWDMASDLIADNVGNIFGTAVCADGYDDYLFEIPAATHKLITIESFDGDNNGAYPGDLVTDGAGDLYGATSEGGAADDGTIFEVPHASGKFQTLTAITSPQSPGEALSLVVDNSGNIYFLGNDYSTIFKLSASGKTLQLVFNFDSTDYSPDSLTVDRFGNLYCTALGDSESADSHRAIFQFAPGARRPTLLHNFGDAVALVGNIVIDQSGNLYGSAVPYSGPLTIFEFHTKSRTFVTLASFVQPETDYGEADLMLDGVGDLFGTAGQVIELPSGSHTIKTFGALPGGYSTEAPLLVDASGNLYGSSAKFEDGEESFSLFAVPHSGYVSASPAAIPDAIRPLSTAAVSSGPALTGQSASAGSPVDLTSLGTGDWAHFGTGGQINAFDDNANASDQISNVTILGSGAEATVSQDPSRAVSWTNGTPDATATDETGYLSVSGSTTAAVSFTVPADQNQRTLYIDAGGTNSEITLTAHLSDGSAADYVATRSGTGVYTNLYTLVYQASADNQTLTITLQKTGNIGSSDGSVDLIAAALRGPTLSKLASFGFDYLTPGFVEDTAGNAYVAAAVGGGGGYEPTAGAVYEFSAGSYTKSTLATFSGSPLGGPLVLDQSGNLYGWEEDDEDTSSAVYGIFEIPAGTHTLETIVPNSSIGDEYYPGQLAVDSAGNLFVADFGLYEVAAGTHEVATLIPPSASSAYGLGITLDSGGDVFGSESSYTQTKIFEVAEGSSRAITLETLGNGSGATLLAASNGEIYGTTYGGGQFGDGTIFEITPGDDHFQTLLSVHSIAGAPFLQLENDGNLLGTSYNGGQVEEFFPASGELVQLATLPFTSGDGLFSDSAGNLYGLAFDEAAGDYTSLSYRLGAATHKVSTAATFPSALGGASGENFVDSAGNFVGIGGSVFGRNLYELSDSGFDTSPSAPVINYQPTDETGIVGQRIAFNASVNSTPAPSVQWQISTDGGKTFTDVTGNPSATTQSLILSDLNADQAGKQFRAVFTNSLGTTISNAVSLSIVPPLKLVSPAHPDAKTVTGKSIGMDALAVDPSGKSKLTYTWSVVKTPGDRATVSFSANGNAASAHVTAKFKEAGKYTLRCTITDGGVRMIITDTPVTVAQTPTQVLIPRGAIMLGPSGTAYVDAYVFDQFGDLISSPQPPIHYSIVAGLGLINSQSGEFTASRFLGPVEVRASSGPLSVLLEIAVEN